MTELNTNYKPNFQTGTGNFKKGWYTFESGIGYRFMYADTIKNIIRINNSRYDIELFESLPTNATIDIPN